MCIGEWIAVGECGVGWRERCGENVLTGSACTGQALAGHCIEVLVDAWKCYGWLPLHAVSVSGV